MVRNSLALVSGLLLVFTSLAFPVNGYHSSGAGIDPRGGTSYEWTNGIPGVIICESEGPADSYNPLPTAKMGDGGLCFAGLKGMAVPTSSPGPNDWTAYAMTVTGGATNVAYTVQVGSYTCSTTTGAAVYINEAYVYWETGGHFAVFNDDPAAPGGSMTSTVGATPPAGSSCDGPIRMGGGTGGRTLDTTCPLDDVVRVCFHDFGNPVPVGIGLLGSPLNASLQIRSYSFGLPTGGKAVVPCPVVYVSGNPTDACALAGGMPGAIVTSSPVIPLTPAPVNPQAYLVDALLDVTAAGFGVQDVPVTVLCEEPDCGNGFVPDFCQCFMIKGTRFGAG